MDSRTGLTDRRTDKQTGRTNKWTDGKTDRWTKIIYKNWFYLSWQTDGFIGGTRRTDWKTSLGNDFTYPDGQNGPDRWKNSYEKWSYLSQRMETQSVNNDTEFTVNLQLLNDAEYVVKNHAKRVGPVLITPFDICIILHLLQKPNEIIVLLFMRNISTFLPTSLLPLRIFSSNHLPVISERFQNIDNVKSCTETLVEK